MTILSFEEQWQQVIHSSQQFQTVLREFCEQAKHIVDPILEEQIIEVLNRSLQNPQERNIVFQALNI